MKTFLKTVAATVISVAMLSTAAFANRAPEKPVKSKLGVEITVDISSQTMNVSVKGAPYAKWKVSTARKGFYTPRGTFSPKRLAKMHYSRKYDNAPMPHSVFFHYGYAIHATDAVKALGRPASHGCVRLSPANASKLFALVKEHGAGRTRIKLVD
jgi:lipoprotein-anchoring transpeptidase ErfK/SrfK